MLRYVGIFLFVFAGIFMLAGQESAFFAKYAILCASGALIYFGASVVYLAKTVRDGLGLDNTEESPDKETSE